MCGGLGERYSSTVLDGARISSPVPFQKTVPLDIVSNSIVRSLLVQKTFSPDYPGDFSGGVVMIRTKATPEENTLSIKAQVGGNSATTGGDGLSYHGGGDDNWGFDDGTRNIPDNIKLLSSEQFEDMPRPASAALGASFHNFWHIREKDRLKPNWTGDAEAGYRHDLDNGASVGLLLAGKYTNDYNNRDKDFRRYEFTGVDGGSTQTVDYQQFTTRQTINWSGFVNLGVEFNNDHSVRLSQIILRQTDDETQQFRGLSSEDDVRSGTAVVSYRLQWTENAIRSTQLKGEHYFNVGSVDQLSIKWRAVDGAATRDAPDNRTYTYATNAQGLEEVVTPNRQAAGDLREVFQAPDRQFAKLRDEIEEYGVDVELPVFLGRRGHDRQGRLVGLPTGSGQPRTPLPLRPDVRRAQPYRLDDPAAIVWLGQLGQGLPGRPRLLRRCRQRQRHLPRSPTPGRTPALGTWASMPNSPSASAPRPGLRREETTLSADAYGGNTEAGSSNAVNRKYKDSLPAASLTFEFINDMQVRLAYSETVNRPKLAGDHRHHHPQPGGLQPLSGQRVP